LLLGAAAAGWMATPARPHFHVGCRRESCIIATAPAVELLQLLPMVPPLSPGEAATEVLRVEGAELSAPVWLPSCQSVAVLDRGNQLLLGSQAQAVSLASGVRAHAPLVVAIGGEGRWQQGSMLAASGGSAGSLRCVSAEGDANLGGVGTVEALPLMEADGLQSAGMLAPLSNGRLLVGLDSGSVVCLSSEDPPVTLLQDAPGLLGACVSDNGQNLYLCTPAAIYQCTLDLDEGVCSAPTVVPIVSPGESARAMTIDVDGNLYVATETGVCIADDRGELLERISTSSPTSGLCFGGQTLSDLYLAAGDSLWRLRTNTQGVQPPSPRFLRMMDMYGTGQVHEAW